MNPPSDIQTGFELSRKYNLVPGFAIYEHGFTRLVAALTRKSKLKCNPIYSFMFSHQFLWGFPPKEQFLNSHIELLNSCEKNAYWVIGGLGVDIRTLIPDTLKKNGHIRIGLKDAPC